MAELKGPIQFIGSIGNIRVYYNKTLKRYIVSTKGGSLKALIKKNPAYARQRECMTEFKACAYWSSLLKQLLSSIDHLAQGYYFQGFMKLAKTIQKHDDMHMRGTRSIESSKDANLLTTLYFNKEHPFEEVFSQRFDIAFSNDRKTVMVSLPGFRSRTRITWPTRYKLYRIALVIAQLSDFEWNMADKCFKPCVDGLERRTVTVFTEWRQQSTEAEDIVLEASFAEAALSLPGTTVIVALGVEVSPGIGDYAGIGSMKIVDCFV
jgi:hypothetical protein